eukprot:scaffold66512_cov46-Attheya_sp.AAC.5
MIALESGRSGSHRNSNSIGLQEREGRYGSSSGDSTQMRHCCRSMTRSVQYAVHDASFNASMMDRNKV